MRRQSMATNSDLDCIQKVRYQNTYRIDPNPDTKFVESTVKNAVYEYLAEELTNVKYEEKDWRLKTRDLGDQIRNQVKSLGFERYKIIVEVLINPRCKTNDLIFGSRLLSDPERDRTVTVIFSNDSLSAVVCVYAIYYDWSHLMEYNKCTCVAKWVVLFFLSPSFTSIFSSNKQIRIY